MIIKKRFLDIANQTKQGIFHLQIQTQTQIQNKSNLHVDARGSKNEDRENIANQTKQGNNRHGHTLNNTIN